MGEIKTKANDADVNDFIGKVDDEQKKSDSFELLKIFIRATGEKPKMWGTSIIGFGQYHYKSERSSQEGDWMLTGFSPRKQTITVYLMDGPENYPEELEELGKQKTSKGSCLYIKKLADVDVNVLEKMIGKSYLAMKARHVTIE